MDTDNKPELTGNDLVAATRPFAREKRALSWFHLITTFTLLIGLLGSAAFLPWLPVRIATGFVGALVMVRAFIIYHDFQHGAILRGSTLAKLVLYPFGMLFSWARSTGAKRITFTTRMSARFHILHRVRFPS